MNQKPLALPDKQNNDSSQSTVHSSSASQTQEMKSASKRGIVDKKRYRNNRNQKNRIRSVR